MSWQLHEAKNRLSELVNRAQTEGPQIITRHGKEEVIVLAINEYRRLAEKRKGFLEYLMEGESLEDVNLERDRSSMRDVDV